MFDLISPIKIVNHGIRLPVVQLDPYDYIKYNIPKNSSNKEILIILCRHGFASRVKEGSIPREKFNEYADRVRFEINVLEKTNFIDYILLVFKIISFRDRRGFVTSYGRGSCGGSLVCHLLNITNCDPIKHDLFFERFISESRASLKVVDGVTYINGVLPDIDLDFSDEERDEVIKFVSESYPGRFVKLCTIGTYATKGLTGELCKILYKWKKEDYEFLTKQVVAKFGKNPTPEEVYKESEIFKDFCDKNPIFYKLLKTIHNCNSTFSSHASAYFISYEHLSEVMPVQLAKSSDPDDKTLSLASSYDMYTAEKIGIKADILGVKSLSLVGNILKIVNEDLNKINLDSMNDIYAYLQSLDLGHGLFQISGDAAIKGLNKIKPKNLEELSVVSAICRPGALEFIDTYADYTNNGVTVTLHPLFSDILDYTAGVVVYQEQVLQMMIKIGFSKEEAETIRRGIGKKKIELITQFEDEAYKRGRELGVPIEATKLAFDLAKKSADYSFNRSHATAYSKLTALTVYLKWKYPQIFFLEAIKKAYKAQKASEPMSEIIPELPFFNIKLLPPDLVKSQDDFSLEDNNIRYGLTAIKHISDQSISNIHSFVSKNKCTKFQVFNLALENKLNVTILAVLIQIGCFLSFDPNRIKMVLESQIWSKLKPRERDYCLLNEEKYNSDLILALRDFDNWNDGKKKFLATRINTIRRDCANYFEIYKYNKEFPDLSIYFYERKLLNYSPSFILRSLFKQFDNLQSIEYIKSNLNNRDRCNVIGHALKVIVKKNKKGLSYLHIDFGDESGIITCRMSADKFARYSETSPIPKDDDVVYMEAEVANGDLFINRMAIQPFKAFFTAKDIPKLNSETANTNTDD